MAYTDFSVFDLRQQFGVQFRAETLFPQLAPIEPTTWLREALRKGQELGFNSEKSRSERLVTPVLMELSDRNHRSFSIYSGMSLDVDVNAGLRGECDFIFSFSRIQDFIAAPVFCIAEAKKQDLELGTIQCAAQLIAARRLNELEKNPIRTIYGCSTTGIEWRFLKYEGNEFILDEQRYFLTELPAGAAGGAASGGRCGQKCCRLNGNLFAELMETVKYCSFGQITNALFEVGARYWQNR